MMSIFENIRGIKGVKNHDKTTLLERLLLKMVIGIASMFIQIVIMLIYVMKLKKEDLTNPVGFRVPVAQLDRAAAF